MVEFIRKNTQNAKDDILSGLTVALALVPEAVAFAFVAKIDPMIGLYGAFMMGLITSIFGGRPGMISGATGAMAVVMVSLVAEGNEIGQNLSTPVENLGVNYLFLTLLLVGLIQMSAGFLKLGKFVRLIPHPVMMGFVNGLAIVIFTSQLGMFPDVSEGVVTAEMSGFEAFFAKAQAFLTSKETMLMLGLVGLTMGIMHFLPKLTKKIPGALTGIIVVAVITIYGGDFFSDVQTVGSFIREGSDSNGLAGSLPTFQSDMVANIPLNFATLKLIFPYALILAAIGLIESLMTLNLIDELTETRGNGNRECIAQGSANMLNGFFGGMGGCAMIGQSIINIKSGGRGRLSGIFAALALLSFILFAAPLIEQIPIAALVGVMFMVVIGTFAWSSFRILNKIPRMDAAVLILVSSLTVIFDLAIAVVAGVIVSALVFSWQNAVRIRARKETSADGTLVYQIWGPLFFGSIQSFNSKFDVKNDPEHIQIDFIESRVSDHSGIEALQNLVNKYNEAGKKVTLTHLSSDCKDLLLKANPKFEDNIEHDVNDPRYYVVADLAE